MRFTWLSNAPFSNSGYGQQTNLFVPRIQALGHDMAVICYYGLEGGILNFNGYTLYPKRFHAYGNDICMAHSASWKANAMFSLMDVWVLEPEGYPNNIKWLPWYPVDHDPMPPIIRNKLSLAFKRIAMSKFGVRMTHQAGLDCYYVPHGIDTKIFYPRDKAESRKELGIPEDKFVVGTVAMNKGNPSRKNFPELLAAFAQFKQRHNDVFYFLQTDRGDNNPDMVNIPEMAAALGLVEGEDWATCSPYQNTIGYPPDYMAKLYSAFDVHMLVSAGEGFGIPTIEAQACGTPVIVGDWTASSELCFSGQKIDVKDAVPFWTQLASYQYRPRTRAVELALEAERRKPSPTEQTVKYIQEEYDVEQVTEKHWKPVMSEIVEALS
jgi:glycosyltransferase involved in cell wall biosynthesis